MMNILAEMREAERKTSEAYLRLRCKIPGALDTPHAPSAEMIWGITERALDALVEKAARYDDLKR